MKKSLMTMLLTLTTVLVSTPAFSKEPMTQQSNQTNIDYTQIQAERTGFISVPGGKIWYRANGLQFKDKKPAILIIHGGPGNSHDYLLPALQLADERMVIFYDQLDSGRSDRTNNPKLWTLARFTDEVDSIRTALNLKEFHILGSSWGGSVAVNYAARKPVGLKSVILSGPLINTQRWVDDNELYRQQLPKATLATMLKYEATKDYANPDYQKAVDFYYSRHLCRLAVWPDYVNNAMSNANGVIYESMWGPTEFLATGSLKTLDLTPLLPKIQTPTLFISGQYDEGTPAAARDFSAMMPKAEVFVVPDASHMPHVEKPELFFNRVRLFLEANE